MATEGPKERVNFPPDPNPRMPKLVAPPGSWDTHFHVYGHIHQTTFLTRSLPGMESHAIGAAYYRDAVQNFREKCARR